MSHKSFRPTRQRARRRIAVRKTTLTLTVTLGLGLAAPVALAEPSGGVIVGGSGSIGGSPGNQVITQQSARLALDWQSFSLAAGERTEFRQPDASAVALNRVIGGTPSEIHGQIVANGQVYLVNPQGVLFGKGAQVDVGGLVASTLDLSARDFMAGRASFADTGGEGRVVNEGSLRAAEGGYVALLGRQVTNAGRIEAPRGTVALAAGEQVSLSFDAHSLVDVSVDRATLDALVENHGAIRADGGMVLLTAQARDALLDTVVNNDGVIEANSVGSVGGVVRLGGGDDGVVQSSGTLAARGDDAGEAGGAIEITGRRIALVDTALVDASGEAGGGSVHVGGSQQGQGPLPNSEAVFVGREARLDASAGTRGDGGKVVVYADDTARLHGRIAATGGAEGGHGGFVETSGKINLDVTDTPLVTAAAGAPGTWLIDPLNIVISATTNQCVGLSGCVNGPDWTSTASGATLGANLITAALNAGQNVTLTTGAGGSDAGDITLLGSPTIVKSAGAADVTLTMSAHNDVGITAPITKTGGSAVGRLNVVLVADSDGNGVGNVALRTPVTTGGGTITASGQNVTVLGNLSSAGTAGRDGGTISLTASPSGALNVAATSVTSAGGTSTGAGRNGGDITLAGGSINVRSRLTSSGGNAGATGAGGAGGAVSVTASGANPRIALSNDIVANGGNASNGAGGASGAVTVVGPVRLGNNVAITSTPGTGTAPGAGSPIELTSTIDSEGAPRSLALNGAGPVRLQGGIGQTAPLAGLRVRSSGELALPATRLTGDLDAVTDGDLRIVSGATLASSGGNVVLAARGGNFINNGGANAISTPNGRWLVYATSPQGNTPNGLVPGNPRPNLYNRTIDSTPPASVTDPGNHYIFSFQPTLTVTANAAGKVYGDGDPDAYGFTTSGLLAGDALADVFEGTMTRAPGENAGAYGIDVDGDVPESPIGYAVTVVPATFTISPRPLTVRAMDASRAVGVENPAFAATFENFAFGEDRTVLGGSLVYATAADLASLPGLYGITPSGLTSTNYQLIFVDGTLTVFDPNPLVPVPPVLPETPSGTNGGASEEAIIVARQNRPGLPPIAELARLDIIEEGILVPPEAR